MSHHDIPKFELIIGRIMIMGIVLSSLVVLAGGCLYLIQQGYHIISYTKFVGEPISLRSTIGILQGAQQLTGTGLIQLGLWLLVATQIVRMILTGYLFAISRDTFFTLFSFIIAIVLIYSIL